IQVLTLDGERRAAPLLHTSFNEVNAEVSPDGRWVAHESDESGQSEVYVRPFPNVDGGRWLVSAGGGHKPVWSRDGRELFYLARAPGPTKLMVSTISTGAASFSAGAPRSLFEGPYYAVPGQTVGGRTYDVSPDGKRFVMIKNPSTAAETEPATAQLV